MQGFPKEWNVIPLPLDSKIPIFKWLEYQKKRFPTLEVKDNSNYAVICGKISNNLLILDVDLKSKKFFEEIYDLFRNEYPELATTRIVSTPHGYHLYYYMEDFSENRGKNSNAGYNKNSKFVGATNTEFAEYLKGFDVLGNNGYAVIPPSKINGSNYEFMNELPIRGLNKKEYELIKGFFLKDKPTSVRQPFLDILNGKLELDDYASKTKKDEFVYWKSLFREVYHFCGLLPTEIFKGLGVNQPNFDEAKTNKQLQYKYHAYTEKPMTNKMMEEYFPEYYQSKGIVGLVEVDLGLGDQQGPMLENLKVKELTDFLADTLIDEFDLISLSDSKQLMIKQGNYYNFDLTDVLKRFQELVRKLNKGSYTTYKKNVFAIMIDRLLIDRDIFCVDGSIINFQNGIYDVLEEKFYPVGERDEIFFYCIPHEYKRGDYDCPNFKKALNQWLVKDDWSIILYDDIFEMMGLCMSTNTSFKKAFLSHGPTNSGKTQLLNLIIYIVGKDNTSSIKLHKLSRSDYASSNLQMKLLNGSGEIPKRKIKDFDLFKELSGDDALIPAEIKFGEIFEFKPYAKFWFNANDMPSLYYIDDAFLGRFILIEFPNQFTVMSEEFKLQFWLSLTDLDEIQSIIHENLKGLKRLIERKAFRNEIQNNTKHIWLYNSDPVYQFIHDHCKIKKGSKVLSDDLYEKFNEYGSEYLTNRSFTVELQKYGVYKRQLRAGAGKRPYFYVNIEMKLTTKEVVAEYGAPPG